MNPTYIHVLEGLQMAGQYWHIARDYFVAVLAVVFAFLIRLWLDPVLGNTSQFATFIFAIIFTAWYGGFGPALVTMILGFLSVAYFFLQPYGSLEIYGVQSQVGALLYLVVGISSMFFSESMQVARRRANDSATELRKEKLSLEREVQERKEAQAAYVDLLRRFLNLQEDERRRIARELHDQSGQDLIALRLGLQSLHPAMKGDAEAMRQLANLHGLFDRISQEWHHLALELRPPALDELGLATAVQGYLETWSQRTKIPADFECRGHEQGCTSEEVDIALYRVIQESLTNVAKHAATPRVSVIIERTPDSISAIIEDQGKGFDVERHTNDVGHQRRLGLLGMQERLSAIGGTLEIESAPGSGTTIYARAPLGKKVE